MIVVDASLIVELVLNTERSKPIRNALADTTEAFIAPHLIEIEVVSALRGLTAGQRIDTHRATQFLADFSVLPITLYPHAPLLGRIWQLRHNFTAYDAAYLALAEISNSALYTCDPKLSKGHRVNVTLFAQDGLPKH